MSSARWAALVTIERQICLQPVARGARVTVALRAMMQWDGGQWWDFCSRSISCWTPSTLPDQMRHGSSGNAWCKSSCRRCAHPISLVRFAVYVQLTLLVSLLVWVTRTHQPLASQLSLSSPHTSTHSRPHPHLPPHTHREREELRRQLGMVRDASSGEADLAVGRCALRPGSLGCCARGGCEKDPAGCKVHGGWLWTRDQMILWLLHQVMFAGLGCGVWHS